jgi:glycosyltransferase involved in cell wall biosynthesis
MTAGLASGRGGQPNGRTDRVVVCVCTKDRPKMFQRCLESLLRQRIPDNALDFHLVVVDNSLDGSERAFVATQNQAGSPPISYVHQPAPGIPVARNSALNALGSVAPDWVAFIDDDEIAPRDWIVRLHAAAEHCKADVASGAVIQFETAAEAQSSAESWQPPSSFGDVDKRLTCATSNVIFRGSLVAGPSGLRFDESMRHGGSDTEFFMRARQKGAKIFAIKDALVFEEYPKERQTLGYECMRSFRVGATTNYRYRKNYGRILGVVFLTERIAAKAFTGLTSAMIGLFAYPFAPALGQRRLRRGVRQAAIAFGCIGPMVGINPSRYW